MNKCPLCGCATKSVLTAVDRKAVAEGFGSIRTMARKFGVSRSAIQRVRAAVKKDQIRMGAAEEKKPEISDVIEIIASGPMEALCIIPRAALAGIVAERDDLLQRATAKKGIRRP